jgi:hypothetical protein
MGEPSDRQLLLSIDRRLASVEQHLLSRPIPKSHDHRQLWAALLGLSAAVISSVWWHP